MKYVVDIRRSRMDMKELIDEMLLVQRHGNQLFTLSEQVRSGIRWSRFESGNDGAGKYPNTERFVSSKDKMVRARPLKGMTQGASFCLQRFG